MIGASLAVMSPWINVHIASGQTQNTSNAYAKQQLNQTNIGGFFQSVYGQQDLAPPNPDTTYKIFVSKEMWLLDGGGNWVEIGDIKGYSAPDGVSSTKYWAGHYYAKQRTNGSNSPIYQRILIGPYNPTGAHTYQATRGSASNSLWIWNFSIDNGAYRGSLYSNNSSFPYMQVGIETNNGLSKFRSGTYANSLYHLNTSNAWTNWPSSGVLDGDNGRIPSWNSVYDGTNRKINFYTNQSWP